MWPKFQIDFRQNKSLSENKPRPLNLRGCEDWSRVGDFRTNFNETSPRCNIEDKVCIVNRAATTLDANFPLA